MMQMPGECSEIAEPVLLTSNAVILQSEKDGDCGDGQ